MVHPDGENRGLMDLIPRCGMDIADAVTPYPMTKIDIAAYYDRWCRSGKLTIQGGIPEMFLLEESTNRDDLKKYMDHLSSRTKNLDECCNSFKDAVTIIMSINFIHIR